MTEALVDEKGRKEKIKSSEEGIEEVGELDGAGEGAVPLMSTSSLANESFREQQVRTSTGSVTSGMPMPVLEALPFLLLIPFFCPI